MRLRQNLIADNYGPIFFHAANFYKKKNWLQTFLFKIIILSLRKLLSSLTTKIQIGIGANILIWLQLLDILGDQILAKSTPWRNVT